MIISTKIKLEHTLNISDNGIYTAQYKSMTLTSAFQPIFDIHNRKIGAEALLRDFDSKGNPIPENVVLHDISVSEEHSSYAAMFLMTYLNYSCLAISSNKRKGIVLGSIVRSLVSDLRALLHSVHVCLSCWSKINYSVFMWISD